MSTPGRSEILGHHSANPSTPASAGTTIATGWCQRCAKIKHIKQVGQDCTTCGDTTTTREWPASSLEDRLTAQFEDEVKRRHRQAYLELLPSRDPADQAEAAEMRRQYMADKAADKYNWDDQGANDVNHVRSARKETWGALHILYLILKRCDPNITQNHARDIWLANPDDALATYAWSLGIAKNSTVPTETTPVGTTSEANQVIPSQATFE